MSESFHIRGVVADDYHRGLLSLLGQLSGFEPMTFDEFFNVMDHRATNDVLTIVAVGSETGEIIGTASLVMERKFSHGGRYAAHVEDVVVDERYRGEGVGSALLGTLVGAAERTGAYKVVLTCSVHNYKFYEKLGFTHVGVEMRYNTEAK